MDRPEGLGPPTTSNTQRALVLLSSSNFTKAPNNHLSPSTPVMRSKLAKGQRELANLAKTQFEDERSGLLTKFRHPRTSLFPPRARSPPIEPVDRASVRVNGVTSEDIETLALWTIEHPRGNQTLKAHYQKFQVYVSRSSHLNP